MSPALVVRWTVGAVSDAGLEALGWSVAGAWQLFGESADYIVCVNSIDLAVARARAGPLPANVEWRLTSADDVPPFLRERLDHAFAEGCGWKLAPVRVAEAHPELALDNDCILWERPAALRAWLESGGDRCVLAEDVRACFGQFAHLCGDVPLNSGVRGLPARFALADSMRVILAQQQVTLRSELDEQGLQIAAVMHGGPPLVITTGEVTICSPFAPHQPHVGTCGAHFVGLNAKRLPWSYEGRPAADLIRANWERLKEQVRARIAR